MKKIISLALIVCMLLSIALPLSVSAAYSTDGSDGKTSRFFYKQSNTGLDAYPGTPTIDGKWTDGEDWSNALPLTMNSTTKALIDNCGISSAYNGEFYLLWDENNLYIMEVQRNWWTKVQTYAGVQASGKDRPWNSWGTAIYVLPTRTFSLNTCKVYGMFIWETSSGADGVTLNAGDTCSALITERYATYSSWPGAVSGGGYGTISSNIDGVNAVFGKTGGSAYVMETSISWDYLGMSAPNANTTTDIVDALGVKLGMGANGGSHLQGNTSMNSGEFTGFDPITLKAEAFNKIDTAKAEAYWTDETNGQFVKNATATEYEISTAEQLLGLSLAMENNANDNTWTEGKTFKLTADIDLNPGVDWAAYKTAVAEGKTDVTSLNYNKWLSFDAFYGVFDGQGHTISGVWAIDAPNGTASATANWGVFGGWVYRGTAIKNVVLDNGYVSSSGSGCFGGIIGNFYHSLGTNDTTTVDDGVLLENIYVGENFTVDASKNTSKQAGGIMASGDRTAHANTGDVGLLDLTFRNVVFAGHFTGANYYAGAFLGQTTYYFRTTYKVNLNLTDCLITGTYEGTNTDLGALGEKRYSEFGSEGEKTDCYDFGNGAEQSIPEELAGKYINTAEGVMPVAVADMMSNYAYQATKADNGTYSIRLIGEVASMAYESVDFKVTITRASDGKSAVWGHNVEGYENAEKVYASVMANGEEKTAATMNDFLNGENNKLYVMTLNGLDTDETYTLSVTTVWTLLDGTTVEGVSVKTVTPAAWVEA